MEPASSASPACADTPVTLAPPPWLLRQWRAFKSALREAALYACGSPHSTLRQIEALREMDPRMLRDMGLDLREAMRGNAKSSKNE